MGFAPMDEERDDICRVILPINKERNVCFFDTDFAGRTREFLTGLDPAYYGFVANQMSPLLSSGERQRAALVLRMTYSQALENFFGLLVGALRECETIAHWLSVYGPGDLQKSVREIVRPTINGIRRSLAENPFDNIARDVLEGSGWDEETITKFAEMWRQFSNDFINRSHSDEYNCLKHGLRAHAGGNTFSVGPEETPGVPASPKAMKVVGHSEFGARTYAKGLFLKDKGMEYRPLGQCDPRDDEEGKCFTDNFRLRPVQRNWDARTHVEGLTLLSISIRNLISHCQMKLGVNPTTLNYIQPESEEAYLRPWTYNVGLQISPFEKPFNLGMEAFLTPKQMKEELRKQR